MSLRIRILIADDHNVVAESLRALIETQTDMEVVATVSNGIEAERLACALTPDVVLMDVTMPELNGIDATRRICAQCPHCKVVILSMHSDDDHVRQAFRAGAVGYVLKRSAARDTLSALRAVHAGARYLDREIAANVIKLLSDGDGKDLLARLSSRECQVLQLLAESHAMQDIASQLGLSVKTVETYRARLMEKLEIRDLPGLVRFAASRGMISLE